MNRPAVAVLLLTGSLAMGCGSAADTATDADDWPRPKLASIQAPADVAAPPADAVKTASGLAYKVLTPGAGAIKPTPAQTIVVHYTGWTTKGEMFDSSVARGAPLTYPLNKLIPGWIEAVQMMTVGERRRLWHIGWIGR